VGAEPRSPLEARGLILTACAVSSRGGRVGGPRGRGPRGRRAYRGRSRVQGISERRGGREIARLHRNTIHHRLKQGRLNAHKVVESDREVYRTELDSLDVGHTSAQVRTLDTQRTNALEELSGMLASRLDETPVSPGLALPLRRVPKALRSRERSLSREMRERSPNGLPSAGSGGRC
jgi:hypothetical protein